MKTKSYLLYLELNNAVKEIFKPLVVRCLENNEVHSYIDQSGKLMLNMNDMLKLQDYLLKWYRESHAEVSE